MRNILFAICVLAFITVSCDDDEKINPDGLVEHTVDINGNWSVTNVTQNNIDITNRFDFQSLNLEFTYDGGVPSSFSMSSSLGVPFAFSMPSGTFTFDDLTYPTELLFSGDQNMTISLAEIPLVSKGNSMKLEVNFGCADNTYVYSFKKN